MKIGIFGGTFNPIHLGHIKLIKQLQLKYSFDILYLIPTNKISGKTQIDKGVEPIKRFEMVNDIVKKINKTWLKVLDFEILKKTNSYTYLTIEHLQKLHPKAKIHLIIGEDRYETFEEWKNYSQILKDVTKLIVVKRFKENRSNLPKISPNVEFFNNKILETSSTDIIKYHRWDFLDPTTVKYISKNKLYLEYLNESKLDEKRLAHVISVANHAKKLAKLVEYKDLDKAYLAGLIHDMFKYESPASLIKIIGKANSNKMKLSASILHGFALAKWLDDSYKINDKELTNAIAKHSTASSKMSKLDKIIFVADKIADNRIDAKTNSLRKLAYTNFDKAFIEIIKNQIDKTKRKKQEPHKYTLEALVKYGH